MSLINQVLNDLDQRRAAGADGQFPSGVRPLPAIVASRRPLWVASVAGGVLVAGVVAWWTLGPGRPLPESVALPAQVVMSAGLPPLNVEPVDAGGPDSVSTHVLPAVPQSGAPVAETHAMVAPESPVRPTVQSPVQSVQPAPSRSPPVAVARPLEKAVAPEAPRAAPVRPRRDEPDLRISSQLSPLVAAPRDAKASEIASSPPESDDGMIEKSVVDVTPKARAERLYRSALGQLNQGRADDGLTTLRAALREDAAHIPARQLLIKFYLDRRAFDSAQGVLRDGLAVLPQQAPWAMLLSRLLADRGENAAALQVLEAHQSHGTANADYQGAVGAILQRLVRDADAELRYAQAVRIDPANARWLLGLALAREAQGKAAEAREAYQRALAARGLSPELQAFVEDKLK